MGSILFKSFSTPAVFSRGGLLVGKSHEEGGIKAVVEETEPIEVEGGEVIINKKAVKKKGVKTRRGTNKEILSEINEETGGVPIMKKGGKVKDCSYKGKTAKQVWDEWTPKQRGHFLKDHLALHDAKRDSHLSFEDLKKNYADIYIALKQHIKDGEYANGGKIDKLLKISYKGRKMAKGGASDNLVTVYMNDNRVFVGNDKEVNQYLEKYKKFKESQIKSMFNIPQGDKMYTNKGRFYRLHPTIEQNKQLIPKDVFRFESEGKETKTETIVEPKELAKREMSKSEKEWEAMRKKNPKYGAYHSGVKETPRQKEKVKKVMHEFKTGKLKSHGKKVKKRKQAVAIAMHEAKIKKNKHPDVSVKKGKRLVHGYKTVKGKKNKVYRKGGKSAGGAIVAYKLAHPLMAAKKGAKIKKSK